MKMQNHKILDHRALGYFLLMLFTLIIDEIFSFIIDKVLLSRLIPGYAVEQTVMGNVTNNAMGVGTAVGAVVAIGLFYLWFRPSFDGMLKKKKLLTGLLLLLPILIVHWIGSVVSWIQFGTAGVLLAFLRAFAPGFGEEAAFRGLGVANYLRTDPSEKSIVKVFWLSSVVFGLVHVSNAIAGAPILISLGQAAYAAGIGMVLCAVYLRTGNLWPCIIGHMSLDFMELIRDDVGSSGGILSDMGAGDFITIVAGVAGIACGLYLIRPSKRAEIVALWKDKWTIRTN